VETKAVFKNLLFLAGSFLFFFIIWQVLAIIINGFLFPSPIEVLGNLVKLVLSGEIFPQIFASLRRVLVGFSLGFIFGSVIGYTLGINVFLSNLFKPILELLRPIPPIAWIPLAILWFGLSDTSAFFIIFIASFFPMFTNVYFGVKSVPLVCERVAKNYKLSFFQKFFHIILPFTLPHVLSASRTAIGFSWMAVIAAEMISSDVGLGCFIEINRVLLQPANVIAAMLMIGIIGFVLQLVVSVLEKKLTSWRSVAYEN
jgi:NitT/TauT family transport system permease protein/sulfonate transport system permease protein